MGAAVVELQPGPEPVAAVGVGPGEESFGVRIAGAQQHQLHVPAEDAIEGVGQDVEAFLRRQPPDHAEERDVGTNREAGLLLQRRLAGRLAGIFSASNRVGRCLIGGRVPFVDVDAVQDADQIATARASTPSRPLP